MARFDYQDKLEILGIFAGGFLIIYALAILSTLPWTTNDDMIAVGIQMFGLVALLALGLVVISMTYTGDLRALLPGRDDE